MPAADAGTNSNHLDRLLETSSSGIVVLSQAGTITRVNDRAQALLGLPEQDIVGKEYTDSAWTFTDEAGEREHRDRSLLVESLVAHFDGDVWTEGNDPKGSVFVVELRLAESDVG